MELIYYPDHDKRYAHIHPLDREDYPDEIRIGWLTPPIKRVKKFSELKWKDIPEGISPCLVAKDVPYTRGCIH